MPLLLLPLLLLIVLALWLLTWPLVLWQRYRRGHARRRAVPWMVGANAWLSLLSLALFAGSVLVLQVWLENVMAHAALGLLLGSGLAVLGLALTRFEREPTALYYTPHRLLTLLFTLVIAARVLFGLWRGWRLWHAGVDASTWAAEQTGLLAVDGALLGYYAVYQWGLRHRVRRGPLAGQRSR